MALTKDQKIAAINAARGPLEHEKYSAELDVATNAEARDEELKAEPEARLKEVQDKLAALDAKEAEVNAEEDNG